ncbi:altronate dehydratase family protein [Rhizobium sp. BK060]|uniref:UxaA family hydrolase n=1 Tax=Rhizobium sp. BK060 TaxID=2587096 RepID=UPI001608C151|nr:altronate dehydratase family protein [Rhizobium sp. BK060]MBB3394229.1 galactarate dehydratase [Rhizobium sp. BK060]
MAVQSDETNLGRHHNSHLSTIRLNDADNVIVATRAIDVGEDLSEVEVTEAVPSGHKIAVREIASGEPVIKYGQVIGTAKNDIHPGQHVHLQNLAMLESHVSHEFAKDGGPTPLLPEAERRTFQGYVRPNGLVGTRNYIGIITSVNCSATVSKAVAEHYKVKGFGQYKNIDGVVALTHGTGCAIPMDTEGYIYLRRVMNGYARNPNFGAILMIGLGCETNQISHLVKAFELDEGTRLHTMTIQQLGGTRKTIEEAVRIIDEISPEVNDIQRTTVSLSGIKLALQCGGSDGYSGITANPALGYAADLLVRNGGTAVLSETPEIYGAEHLLTRRAATPAIAEKLMARIDWWRNYTDKNGAELNNNPSHGNKEGGLTTILEKSLGAVAKGGSMPLQEVYEYGEIITEPGFVFMDTPGYDPVAVTGQVAGGCNLIVFTTGRGSVSGFKPAPCIKVATNSEMYTRMSEDMDINCGGIIDGTDSIKEAGERIFERIIAVASGEHTLSEDYNYGDNEFVPWQIGAVT